MRKKLMCNVQYPNEKLVEIRKRRHSSAHINNCKDQTENSCRCAGSTVHCHMMGLSGLAREPTTNE